MGCERGSAQIKALMCQCGEAEEAGIHKGIAKASEIIPHAGLSVLAMQLPLLLDKRVLLLFSCYEEHQCNRAGNTPAGPLSCKKNFSQALTCRLTWTIQEQQPDATD